MSYSKFKVRGTYTINTPITENDKQVTVIVEKILLGFNELHLLCRNVFYPSIRPHICLTAEFKHKYTFVDRIPGFCHYPNISNSGIECDSTLFCEFVEWSYTEIFDNDVYTEYIPILPMIMQYKGLFDKWISIGFNEPYNPLINYDPCSNGETHDRIEILHPEYFTFSSHNDDLYTIIFTTGNEYNPWAFFPEITGDSTKTEYLHENHFTNLITGKQYSTYLYRKYRYRNIESENTDYNYSICDRPCYNKEFIQTMYDAILKEINENTDIVKYLGEFKTPLIAKVYPTRSKTFGKYLLVVE